MEYIYCTGVYQLTAQEFEIKNKIVSFLRKHEAGASASEIAKEINHNRITIGKYLQVLKAENILTSKKVASAIFWQIADYSKKYRILIVDDEKHIVDLIRLSLANNRYDFYEAYDGKEALLMIGNIVPDLIILDLMMPEISGVEVTKRLKENPLTQNIPIIILSAKGQIEDKTEMLKLDIDDYISKPFDPLELEARVSNKLRKKMDMYSQNSITGLPSVIMTQETRHLWEQKKQWFEMKVSLRQFGEYASLFGHKKSFEVLQLFTRMLINILHGKENVFLGHVCESEFAIFLSEKNTSLKEDILKRFEQMIPFFYSEYSDQLISKPDTLKIKRHREDIDHKLLHLDIEEISHG